MQQISLDNLSRYKVKPIGKRARRNLIIKDIENLIGGKDIWRFLNFPIYIPTEWLESWKEPLILHRGNKSDKLWELLKESRTKL